MDFPLLPIYHHANWHLIIDNSAILRFLNLNSALEFVMWRIYIKVEYYAQEVVHANPGLEKYAGTIKERKWFSAFDYLCILKLI